MVWVDPMSKQIRQSHLDTNNPELEQLQSSTARKNQQKISNYDRIHKFQKTYP